MPQKIALIIGGSSGLGLQLAERYAGLGHIVHITGRKDPKNSSLHFHHFPIDAQSSELTTRIDTLVSQLPQVDTLIYAAGFYQEGHIDQLSDADIFTMANVGLIVPALLVQRLKKHANHPLNITFVTSTSQFTPRELEPVYTAVKSGLGMLGSSLAMDSALGQVLVVAPAGMNTPFWIAQKDTTGMLNVVWVADQIMTLSEGAFKYRFAKIMRNPARVEIIETV